MSAKQKSPSTARNRDAIVDVLRRVLAPDARVLEVASGTGEHALYFTQEMPGLLWQPSDPEAIRTPTRAQVLQLGQNPKEAAMFSRRSP